MHLWRNLIELVKIDEHELRHRLVHLSFLRENQVVAVTPLQFGRQEAAAESALVEALFGDEERSHRVAVLAMRVSTPLVHHAEKPRVKPVCPVWIVGGNGAGQGTDVVLAVPLVVAQIEILFYRIVILDVV